MLHIVVITNCISFFLLFRKQAPFKPHTRCLFLIFSPEGGEVNLQTSRLSNMTIYYFVLLSNTTYKSTKLITQSVDGSFRINRSFRDDVKTFSGGGEFE